MGEKIKEYLFPLLHSFAKLLTPNYHNLAILEVDLFRTGIAHAIHHERNRDRSEREA